MRNPIQLSIAAAIAAVSIAPGVAAAQPLPTGIPKPPAPRDARPPLPPGVPTNADNVHLPTEGEVKLGRQSAVEVEKIYKVLPGGPYHERLQRISREIVKAILRQDIAAEYRRVYKLPKREDKARRVPFEFSFKVVDSVKEINAFSLAGGPIYVTRGLMDKASDHELAAVLAHECTHVAFHHVEQLVKKQRKLNSAQLWGLLATVIAGAAGGGAAASAASNVMMGAQLVSIATLTGYGRELEHEADRIAVRAVANTRYHPVGMLTFMQKLARDERLRGSNLGIFQTHPYSNERVDAIRKEVEALGYRADLGTQRQVSGTFRVLTVPQRFEGRDAVELHLNGNRIFTVVAGEGSLGPAERAEKMAVQLQSLFEDNLTFNDVKQSTDKRAVLLKGIPVIRTYPEDAAVMGGAEAATERAYNEIIRALLKEQLDKPF